MKDFFTEDDFYSRTMIQEYIGSPVSGKVISVSAAAKKANDKLQAEIEKWPVVFCEKLGESNLFNEHGPGWIAKEKSTRHIDNCTHQARLAFIEELPKKECDHTPFLYMQEKKWMCVNCKIEMMPVKWVVCE